jgi:replicative DNA helicase
VINIGLACGPQPNGLNIVVIDLDPKNGGFETWAAILADIGSMPETAWHGTPSGGRHYFFDSPVPIRNSRRLGPGVDVRGEGGQVVLPPSRRRDAEGNILPYTAERGWGLWKHDVAVMPKALIALCVPAERPLKAVPVVWDHPGDFRHDESPAEWVRRNLVWPIELANRGWVDMGAGSWKRPGKTDAGSSAELHDDEVFNVFTTEISPGLERVGKLDSSGTCLSFSLFDFIAGSDFGGDRGECASWVRRTLMPVEDRPQLSVVPAGTAVEHLVEDEAPPKRQTIMAGDVFLYEMDVDVPARWGHGSEVFWASGESLILAGGIGSGKTTVAGQLLAGMCGLNPVLLGQPIVEAKRILYLAMDRPVQIAKALRRNFPEAEARELAHDHLVFHWGVLPKLIANAPEQLVLMAQEHGCDVVFVDALYNLGGSLSEETVGAAITRSFQLCLAAGIDVMALHHTRKESNAEGAKKEDTLASVYGSNWITAGAGSVLMFYGEPGALDQKMKHLKAPVDPLGPYDIVHDNHAGTTSISRGWDAHVWLIHRGATGGTIAEATQAEHGRPITTESVRKKTERKLEGLVRDGRARKEGQARPGSPVRYFADGRQTDIPLS